MARPSGTAVCFIGDNPEPFFVESWGMDEPDQLPPQVWRVLFAGPRKFHAPLKHDFCVLSSSPDAAVRIASSRTESPSLIGLTLVYGTRYCDKLEVASGFDLTAISPSNPATVWGVVGYANGVRQSLSMLSFDPLAAVQLWQARHPGGRIDHVVSKCLIHLVEASLLQWSR
jgi:hypothetical protein